MDVKLKACPFCGFNQGKGEEEFATSNQGKGTYSVYCERCHATGPMRSTMDMAIFAWNERHQGDSDA